MRVRCVGPPAQGVPIALSKALVACGVTPILDTPDDAHEYEVVLFLLSPESVRSFEHAERAPRLGRLAESHPAAVAFVVRSCRWQHVTWLRKVPLLGSDAAAAARMIATIAAARKSQTRGRPTVFVSYARVDAPRATLIRAQLEAGGIGTWQDIPKLTPGDDWQKEIDAAIRASTAVVVLLTAAGAASPWVTYEWSFALGAGIRVVPVLLEDVDPHPRLATLQNMDFRPAAERPWSALVEVLTSLL